MNEPVSRRRSVAGMLSEVAARQPDDAALIQGSEVMTYGEVDALSRRVAAVLRAAGVRAGDRVAIVVPNSIGYAAAYFGSQYLGAITVLVNTRLAASEIDHVLTDSKAVVVVTSAEFVDKTPVRDGAGAIDVEELCRMAAANPEPADDFAGTSVSASSTAQLLYTSGTTGRPKGVQQTHANLMFNAESVARHLEAAPGERTLIAAPMFHAIGVVSQLVGFAAAGATSVIMREFDAVAAAELIARERVTIFAGVPAMLRLLLLKAADAGHDLSCLRKFVMGGSPVPASLPDEVADFLPGLVLGNVWGQTEASSITTYTEGADYAAHPGSAGKPVAGLEVWVSVEGAPPQDVRDTPGELCIRGPSVAAGYWGNAAATAETFVADWLYTGDVGTIDADGHVYVHDRVKDMIIRGGENIYSLEVENALVTHESVAEVAVVGAPDPVLGERVCAVIVAGAGVEIDEAELRRHAARSLADFKIPADFIVVDALPRNATGKILKRTLAARLAADDKA